MNANEYNILLDGEIIFCGTESECRERFNLDKNNRLHHYVARMYQKPAKLLGKYDVEIAKSYLDYLYDFYEGDRLVFTGTSKQFKEKFVPTFKGSVSSYATTNSLIRGKWKAIPTGQAQKKKTKFELKVDYICAHLEKYGNTVTADNPEKYLQAVSEKGFPFKYRQAKNGLATKERFWVLTVC